MQVTHTICLNGGNLTRQENATHNPSVTGTNHSTLDTAALKNEIVMRGNEYQRKSESKSEIKKMYQCQDCNFATNWSSNLIKHERFQHNPSEIKQIYNCQDCAYSTIWLSNLRRHEKFKHNPNDLRKHEKAKHNPLVTEYHCTINVTAMKNEIMNAEDEYQKKLALGREIKKIVQELNVNIACLPMDMMEALQLFENHGQVKHDEWRPWL